MITIILIIYFLVLFGLVLLLATSWHSYERIPDQPIQFTHRIHASRIGLPCQFCHEYAQVAARPGIPPVQKCIDCHEHVATERPEIKKLLGYWGKREPIPWIRVHSLPEYVYFIHKRHVKRGLPCAECHGDVPFMEKIRRVRSLKMGWCVSCHRYYSAPRDCLTCHQ